MSNSSNSKNIIAALDLGTSSIKAVVIDLSANEQTDKFYISSVGQTESKGIRKGVVINIDYTAQNIREVIRQAEALALTNLSQIILGISGAHLEGFSSNGVVKVKYNEVSSADTQAVLEAAKAIAVPHDREIIHVLPQSYTVDGQAGIQDPLGISAVRLESSVHIVTASRNAIQNSLKCMNRCGFRAKDLTFNGIASAQAVTSPEERSQGVCVIDIGAGTADMVIYSNGELRYSKVLPLGGGLITRDLASGLRTGVLNAEKLKCEHGFATPAAIVGEKRVEVKSISNQVSKIVSTGEISGIIKFRVTEIFECLLDEIEKSNLKHFLTAGIVLTGGTANLKAITTLAEDIFNMPVRVGRPLNINGLADFVDNPEFANVVGLIQNYVREPKSVYVSNQNVISRSYHRITNWFQDHF